MTTYAKEELSYDGIVKALQEISDYTALGEGELPIKEILSILKENAYDGYISLEWENAWRAELRKYSMDINDILSDFIAFVQE